MGGMTQCIRTDNLQFDVPLFVLCGDKDKNGTVRKCIKDWEKGYENCQTKIISEAGHIVNLDSEAEFNKKMLTFLAKCADKNANA